jgi:hypothetical protein
MFDSQPEQTRRPAVVTAAGYLLILMAVLEVVNIISTVASMNKVLDATRQAYGSLSNVDTVVNATRIAQIAGIVVGLLFAVGYVILAMLDLRGRYVARIVTWVVAGISVLCFGCGAIGAAGSGALSSLQRGNVNGVDVQEATRQINAATPAYVKPIGLSTLSINLIAAILVIVLLALPAANAYFRRGREIAEPPVPGVPYPPVPGADPAYPAVPGADPAYPPVPGGQPDNPPAPGGESRDNPPAPPPA